MDDRGTKLRPGKARGTGRQGTSQIEFTRLDRIPLDTLAAHMSDPRMAEHMPLLSAPWDLDAARAFVAAKEDRWRRDGLGHWAILADGHYVGWGGFQLESGEWDYGLVLVPDAFGLGVPITRKALAFARADRRIQAVTFLLPPSRRHLAALRRLGADDIGEIRYEGAIFRKFRLQTAKYPG